MSSENASLQFIMRGCSLLPQTRKIDTATVRKVMLTFSQHDLLTVEAMPVGNLDGDAKSKYGTLIYGINFDAVLNRIRIPKLIGLVHSRYGEVGVDLVEILIIHGRMAMSQFVEILTCQVAPKRSISVENLNFMFERMIADKIFVEAVPLESTMRRRSSLTPGTTKKNQTSVFDPVAPVSTGKGISLKGAASASSELKRSRAVGAGNGALAKQRSHSVQHAPAMGNNLLPMEMQLAAMKELQSSSVGVAGSTEWDGGNEVVATVSRNTGSSATGASATTAAAAAALRKIKVEPASSSNVLGENAVLTALVAVKTAGAGSTATTTNATATAPIEDEELGGGGPKKKRKSVSKNAATKDSVAAAAAGASSAGAMDVVVAAAISSSEAVEVADLQPSTVVPIADTMITIGWDHLLRSLRYQAYVRLITDRSGILAGLAVRSILDDTIRMDAAQYQLKSVSKSLHDIYRDMQLQPEFLKLSTSSVSAGQHATSGQVQRGRFNNPSGIDMNAVKKLLEYMKADPWNVLLKVRTASVK
jgi:hypothetical protein